MWLDFVWSLVVLNKASASHIQEVLSDEFVKSVMEDNPSLSPALKLLNIDGAAKFLLKYEVPILDSTLKSTAVPKSREKQEFVDIVIDTLKNFTNLESNVKINVNTQMGFCIGT